MRTYYSTLFNPGELACFARYARGTSVYSAAISPAWAQFVSLNPLHPHDRISVDDITAPALPPKRADRNVAAFRSFLIECDTQAVEVQLAAMRRTFLYSTAVFSGNKSVHFVLSLAEPLASRKEYDLFVDRLYQAAEKATGLIVDKSCRNPSRLTRAPGVVRLDTGKEQTLLDVRRRWTKQELEALIERVIGPPIPKPERVRPATPTGRLSGWLLNIIAEGAPEGTRHKACYRATCELYEKGWEEEAILELLYSVFADLSEKDIERAVGNAIERVLRDK